MRKEKDFIGVEELPDDALYGIHSLRAKNNFTDSTRFHNEWYEAVGYVKLACYETYAKFAQATKNKYGNDNSPVPLLREEVVKALSKSAKELMQGLHFDHFIIPALQGGAGTSINLNINEIIANRALQIMGNKPGEYNKIDPIEHANIFQSTNDVIPTALKVAAMKLLEELEESINVLRNELEKTEQQHRNDLRIGYTQLQEAVPASFGKLFSAYNEALSRDWWRVSKCFERIKVVNLGGSAIGTGITVPTYFIMEVVPALQRLTGMPVTRSENLSDPTSNLDSFVEVHAIMKAHAVNLEKMVSDLRLLSSDLVNSREIEIPKKQLGSSIMPGKVNPVIPEYVISVAHKIYSNDMLITSLSGQGQLELNAYIPVIGHALLDSLKLLISANRTIKQNLLDGLNVNPGIALDRLLKSPSITTALSPYIGYNKASELAHLMKKENLNIYQANEMLDVISEDKLKKILRPSQLLKLGYQLNDLMG